MDCIWSLKIYYCGKTQHDYPQQFGYILGYKLYVFGFLYRYCTLLRILPKKVPVDVLKFMFSSKIALEMQSSKIFCTVWLKWNDFFNISTENLAFFGH